jgi:hypothetical protein
MGNIKGAEEGQLKGEPMGASQTDRLGVSADLGMTVTIPESDA